jgi:hypothetical protein
MGEVPGHLQWLEIVPPLFPVASTHLLAINFRLDLAIFKRRKGMHSAFEFFFTEQVFTIELPDEVFRTTTLLLRIALMTRSNNISISVVTAVQLRYDMI